MLLMKIKTISKIPQNYLQSRVAFFSIVFQLQAILISSLLFQQKPFVEEEQLDPHGFHRLAPDEEFLKRKTFSLKLFECIETSYCSMKICCPNAVSIKLNNNYFSFSSRLDLVSFLSGSSSIIFIFILFENDNFHVQLKRCTKSEVRKHVI